MIEVWRDIENYEGFYQVSNYGKVKNVLRDKILKGTIIGRGYIQVSLNKNHIPKHFYVHVLVGKAFIPNPENKPCIDHKDTNPQNNFVWVNDDGSVDLEKSNLRWCTYKENSNNPLTIKHNSEANKGKAKAKGHRRVRWVRGPLTDEHKNKISKSRNKKVYQYSKDGTFIQEWVSVKEVEKQLGFKHSNISACCNDKYKTAYSYIWKYQKNINQ